MPLGELVVGVAAYLVTGLSLALASWALTELALPSKARLGLRLAAILAGQFALCSIVVQTLGILGLLRVPWYLAASLAPGIAVLWLWRRRRPLAALFGLLRRAFRLWILAPPWALGWLGLFSLLYFAKRSFVLPRDIDALTLHGPMIVEWISAGRVPLGSFWNYPQCWEYQFVPSFLLLRSDVLVAIPGFLGVVALLLAVLELAARLSIGGRLGHLLAFTVATLPIVWREPLKNDPVFAFALLLGILAADRAARRLRGGFWLFQLSVFLVFGTKPSGFLYVGALAAAYLAVVWLTRRGEKSSGRFALLPALLFTLFFQGSAAAVQLWNFLKSGNPVFPLRFELLGRVVFPGKLDLSGTSILDHLGQVETWKQLLFGGGRGVGAEWPLLPALALLAALVSVISLVAARRLPRAGKDLALILPLVASLLWVLFIATPWSRGVTPETMQFLRSGNSLRYAIAALALSYLVAAVVARRFLGRAAFPLLAIFFPLLVFEKWSFRDYFGGDGRVFLQGVFVAWILLAGLDGALRRWRPAARLLPRAFGVIFLSLLLVLATVSAHWIEASRAEGWAIPQRAVWTETFRLPPGTKIGSNDGMAAYRYFLYGRGFENQVVVVDLAGGDPGQIPDELAYFYVYSNQGKAHCQALVDAMLARGWRVLAKLDDGTAALLERPRP